MISILKTYRKSDELTYQYVPFTVREDIERIVVTYSYLRHRLTPRVGGQQSEEVNIIDLGLLDEHGELCGWSGSQLLSIHVGESSSSPGYRRAPIKSGTWHLILGIYKVQSEVDVSITIKVVEKQRRWLKGDLHLHTVNSDGIYTTAEVIQLARSTGLDFIALTDHNNTEQNKEIGNPDGITVIPGIEYTNYKGHANFFFSDDGIFTVNPLSNTDEEFSHFVTCAQARGAVMSLNHPFDTCCPWLLGFDQPCELVEVWNGFPKPSDRAAITWWHEQLSSGRKIVAVGGSDTHRIEQGRSWGNPTTHVYARSPGRLDILEALVEGRVSISATADGAALDLRIGSAGLGETARYQEDLAGTIIINGARRDDIVVLYSDEGEEQRFTVEFDGTVHLGFPVKERRFYRAELFRVTLGMTLLNALTNPVYLSRAVDSRSMKVVGNDMESGVPLLPESKE